MFGYITVNRGEMKLKDYETYHSYYCGLCHELKKGFGRAGQMTLSYDMTLLYVLLSGLYEPEETVTERACVLHPARKQPRCENEFAAYAAQMNVLLSYYDLMDDWQDEGSRSKLLAAKALGRRLPAITEAWPRQAKAVEDYVKALGRLEEAAKASGQDLGRPGEAGASGTLPGAGTDMPDPDSLDAAAGLTGTMLGEIFCMKEDEWSASLRRFGFFLGKFIYLMDAWEDRTADAAKGAYNVWLRQGRDVSAEEAAGILNLMMGECARCFEALPVLKNADIIRNIIYSGVWTAFEQLKKKNAEGAEDNAKDGAK